MKKWYEFIWAKSYVNWTHSEQEKREKWGGSLERCRAIDASFAANNIRCKPITSHCYFTLKLLKRVFLFDIRWFYKVVQCNFQLNKYIDLPLLYDFFLNMDGRHDGFCVSKFLNAEILLKNTSSPRNNYWKTSHTCLFSDFDKYFWSINKFLLKFLQKTAERRVTNLHCRLLKK